MIYALTFECGRVEWCTAKNILHLMKYYDSEFGLSIKEIKNIEQISDKKAKTIMVRNSEFDEENKNDMPEKICLYNLSFGNEFKIIASTEY